MNWKRNIIIFIVIFLLVGLLMRGGGCRPGGGGAGRPADAEVVEVKVAGGAPAEQLADYSYSVRAEVAASPEKRKQGLVGRGGLEPGYGMIYVYEEPDRPEFSWAGMKFDVSAAFMRPDGTITQIHRPGGGETLRPEEPIKYVLEVRRGWFEDRKLGPGHRLVIPQELTGAPAEATGPAEQPAEEEGPAEREAPPAPRDE